MRLQRRQVVIARALAQAVRLPTGSPAVLQEAVRYCVFSEGKRYRPLLCLAGSEAIGGSARAALPVACAIELIHTYSLVHDDLPAMDNADSRRGRAACHRKFGEGTAILVGDALLTRAFELLASPGIANSLAVIRAIAVASGASGLIGGQSMDLDAQAKGAELSPAMGEEIARRKTAALITASVVAGGLAGGASARDAQRLRRYGSAIGLAFQLIDDCHDDDGLAKLLGREAVRCRAEMLIDQAKRAVTAWGGQAASLMDLADWLATTNHGSQQEASR